MATLWKVMKKTRGINNGTKIEGHLSLDDAQGLKDRLKTEINADELVWVSNDRDTY